MASNLTIESPNFEKIRSEAGQFTSDAINTLWSAENDTRKQVRTNFRLSKDILSPRVLLYAPTASVDNLDLSGCSVIQFTGSSSVNLTGILAPETGQTRLLVIHVTGSGTITAKHGSASSDSTNRLSNSTAADVTLSTNKSAIYLYLSSLWRQIV